VSFLVLALFWFNHTGIFQNIKTIDSRSTWLSIFFLMFVSLIPFSSTLAAEHWKEPVTAMIYALNMLIPFLFSSAVFLRTAKQSHRLHEKIDESFFKADKRAILIICLLFILAIFLSLFNTAYTFIIIGGTCIFYIIAIWFEREGTAIRRTS
jgi:uncharacterized membrane protein